MSGELKQITSEPPGFSRGEVQAKMVDGAVLYKVNKFLGGGLLNPNDDSVIQEVINDNPERTGKEETHLETALRLRNEMVGLIDSICPQDGDDRLAAANERTMECYMWIREFIESR